MHPALPHSYDSTLPSTYEAVAAAAIKTVEFYIDY
jgi:hypothetical protein